MKLSKYVHVSVILFSLFWFSYSPYLLGKARAFPCYVLYVLDGDTFQCKSYRQQKNIRVRLAEIDAPEKEQPFGKQSTQALKKLILRKHIKLKPLYKDKYGRLIAYVYANSRDINAEMLRRGMAWVYPQYAKTDRYYRLQSVAKKNKKGLWKSANPIEPSVWRKHHQPKPHHEQKRQSNKIR